MQMGTETNKVMRKKTNRISISEINEKNALITDRRNARIETVKQKNKCGCNIILQIPHSV